MSNAKPLFSISKKQVDFAQAKAIGKLQRKVGKLVKINKIDSHFYDTVQSLTPGNTSTIGVLTAIAQGDTEIDRDGDAISLRYLSFKFTLAPNQLATGTDAMRVMLFRWKSAANGTAPSVAYVLASTTNINSPLNRDYRESINVLHDQVYDCSKVNGSRTVKVNTSLHNSVATFYNGTAAGINENHVYFLILATDNTNKAAISYYSRVTFSP